MMSSIVPAGFPPDAPRDRLDRATILFAFVFMFASYYMIFRLPFRFPPAKKIVSPSLVFGFNNSVAIASVVMLIGVATLFQLCRRQRSLHRDPSVKWFFVGEVPFPSRIRLGVFVLMVLAHALLTVTMWVHARTSTFWRIDFEASHFLWRLQLMDLFGARPYVDFQHEYGPALLYLPLFLHRILAPAGVSLEAAYYASYLAGNVLGMWALLLILNQTVMPRVQKEVAFCVLAAAGLMPYMGLNGNLVRYVPPYLSILLAHRVLSRPRGHARGLIVVAVLGLMNFLISPEIGVAFVVGWGAYCLFTACTAQIRAILALSGLAVAVGLSALMLPREYAGSLLSFSGGANNFPLLPAAHIVFYLATVFVAVPRLLADALVGRDQHGALLFSMATVCVIMIPGALSRADPPHVLFFGLGVSMLLLVQAGIRSRQAFAFCAALYAAVIIGGCHVSNARSFYGISMRSLRPSSVLVSLRSPEPKITAGQLRLLDKYPPLGLPYCSYGADRQTMAHLWSRRKIDPEYYCGIIGVYSEQQLSRKLAETRRHEYLLVNKSWLGPIDVCRRHLDTIRRSFIYYASLPCKYEALETDLAVNRTIVEQYRVVEDVGWYVVMRRVTSE